MSDPIQLFKDELSSVDIGKRRQSMKRLVDIAKAAGPDAAREKLIPFVQDRIDDDDEVLFEMATQLGDLAELVGGADRASVLLQPLEALCNVEETVVRDAAAKSICKIIDLLPDQVAQGTAVPMVIRLANGDWFTSKVSSCALVASAYAKSNGSGKQQLLQLFCTQLAKDDTPMVRRAVAKQLGAICSVVEAQEQHAKVVPLYKEMVMNDQNETVRLLALEQSPIIAANIKDVSFVLDVVKPQFQELSWRIRNSVTKGLGELAKACGSDLSVSQLGPLLPPLLVDPEAEVRLTVCNQLVDFCNVVGAKQFRDICMPQLMAIAEQQDEDPRIKASAANVIMFAGPKLGKEYLSSDSVMPFVKRLVNDPGNSMEVTTKVLPHIDELIGNLNVESVQTFCKDVLMKMLDANEGFDWRARAAAAKALPIAAKELQKGGVSPDTFFEKNKLFDAFLELLNDRVSDVRETCANSFSVFHDVLGVEWTTRIALPCITDNLKNMSYLRRISSMKAITCLAKAGPDLSSSILKLFQIGLKDKVPNVRIAALVGMMECWKNLNQTDTEEIATTVKGMVDDEDDEVRMFALQMSTML